MQTNAVTVEIPIQVFMVFFAISWGALANALPRWKAFDTGRFWSSDRDERPQVRRRFRWSFVALTILPAIYFAAWLVWIGGTSAWHVARWDWRGALAISCAAVGAWTPPFGFYRIWAAVVQWRAKTFYPMDLSDAQWREKFGSLQKDDLSSKYAGPNLAFAVLYLAISIIVPLIYLSIAWQFWAQ